MNKLRLILPVISIVLLLACQNGQDHHAASPAPGAAHHAELIAVPNERGWGYQILVDGKLYIDQPTIPVIQGVKAFASKDQALAVGKRAVEKLQAGKSPAITSEDLAATGILPPTDSATIKH